MRCIHLIEYSVQSKYHVAYFGSFSTRSLSFSFHRSCSSLFALLSHRPAFSGSDAFLLCVYSIYAFLLQTNHAIHFLTHNAHLLTLFLSTVHVLLLVFFYMASHWMFFFQSRLLFPITSAVFFRRLCCSLQAHSHTCLCLSQI